MGLPGGLAGASQERDSKVFCAARETTALEKGTTARILGELSWFEVEQKQLHK